MKTEIKCCENCGQSLRANWHTFGEKMARMFVDFARTSNGEPMKLRDAFGNDTNRYCNFQKLRYFGVVVHHKGKYQISAKGHQFLRGDIPIPKKVFTVQNKVERAGKDIVFLADVLKERAEWQKEHKSIRLPIRAKQVGLF